MITKTGRVEAGVTPSAASGRRSEVVREGEALRADECLPVVTVEKVARMLAKTRAAVPEAVWAKAEEELRHAYPEHFVSA